MRVASVVCAFALACLALWSVVTIERAEDADGEPRVTAPSAQVDDGTHGASESTRAVPAHVSEPPAAAPFVRQALPLDEDEVLYELKLVLDPTLADRGRAEAEARAEAETAELPARGRFWFKHPRPEFATVHTYRGNGFGGLFAELVFDARPDVVRVRAGTFRDAGPPFETCWRSLEGRVTVSDLTLASGTWIEVDLTGDSASRPDETPSRWNMRHLVRPTR